MNKLCLWIFIFLPFTSLAQRKEAGLWTGLSIEKKISKNWDYTISPELRIENNFNSGASFFVDNGFEYKLNNWFKPAIHYRYIVKQSENDLSTRHRYFIDLNFSKEVRVMEFKYRTRLQQQFKDIQSSDDGAIPTSVIRNKFITEYKYFRRYKFSSSYEFWLPVNQSKSYINHHRFAAGLDYIFSYKSSFGFNYVIDIDREGKIPINTYSSAISYKYRID